MIRRPALCLPIAALLAGCLSVPTLAQTDPSQGPATAPAARPTAKAQPAAPPAAKPDANAAEIEFWSAVKDSKNAAEIKAYLETYPQGAFATLARVRIKTLESGGTTGAGVATPAVAPSAIGSQTREVLMDIQARLYALNFPIQKIDGQLTAETIDAVRRWQTQNQFPATGQMTDVELVKLRSQLPPKVWGALAFTSKTAVINWNLASRKEAEEKALADCAAKNTGDCKVTAVAVTQCVAAAGYRERVGAGTASGISVSRQNNVSNAQIMALAGCGKQPMSQGRCEIVEKVCGNGSHQAGVGGDGKSGPPPAQPKRGPKLQDS